MYLCVKATTGQVFVVFWLIRTVRMKTARERWERSNLQMIVAFPMRKNEANAKMSRASKVKS